MKTFKATVLILLSALSYTFGERHQPLDNAGIYELARHVHGSSKEKENLIGKKVIIIVTPHKKDDGTASGSIVDLSSNLEPIWAAHLISFSANFFDKIEDGRQYLIDGIIVENRMDYGAFWIYVNHYEQVEQAD